MFTITIRGKATVERERYEDAGQALAAIERHTAALASTAGSKVVTGPLARRFEPIRQVVGRVELAGPQRLRGGVDVRGDGSSEAYTGRVRRTLVTQREGESASRALGRELGL